MTTTTSPNSCIYYEQDSRGSSISEASHPFLHSAFDLVPTNIDVPGARHELIKADELTATSQNLAHLQVFDPSCPGAIPSGRSCSDVG